MNQKFKISFYRSGFVSFIFERIREFIVTLILLGIAIFYVVNIIQEGADKDAAITLVIIFSLLGLIVLKIFFDIYPLTYTLTLTDDGRLVETQILNHPREILVSDIASAKWSYMELPFFYYRYELTGLEGRFNYGVKLMNPKFPNFPKYPVSVDFITELKKIRPDLVIDNLPKEGIPEIQRRRRFSISFAYYAFGIFIILFGVFAGGYIWYIFGGGLIFAGWYTGKQK